MGLRGADHGASLAGAIPPCAGQQGLDKYITQPQQQAQQLAGVAEGGSDTAGVAGLSDPALQQQPQLQRSRGASPNKGAQQVSLRNYFGAGSQRTQRTQQAQQQTLRGAGGLPCSGSGAGQENGGALAGVKRKLGDSLAV